MLSKNGKNEGVGIISIVIFVILAILLLYYFFSPNLHPKSTKEEYLHVPLEVPTSINSNESKSHS